MLEQGEHACVTQPHTHSLIHAHIPALRVLLGGSRESERRAGGAGRGGVFESCWTDGRSGRGARGRDSNRHARCPCLRGAVLQLPLTRSARAPPRAQLDASSGARWQARPDRPARGHQPVGGSSGRRLAGRVPRGCTGSRAMRRSLFREQARAGAPVATARSDDIGHSGYPHDQICMLRYHKVCTLSRGIDGDWSEIARDLGNRGRLCEADFMIIYIVLSWSVDMDHIHVQSARDRNEATRESRTAQHGCSTTLGRVPRLH